MIAADLTLFDSRLLVTSDSAAALDFAAEHLPFWAHEPQRVSDTSFTAALCVVVAPSAGDVEYWRSWVEHECAEGMGA
jgi:hypothetical protein